VSSTSFLIIFVASSSVPGANLYREEHYRQVAEAHFPSHGRGLVSAANCIVPLIQMTNPGVLEKWQSCVNVKAEAANLQVAGSLFEATLDCWCEHKIEDTLTEFGCCQHRDFAVLCQSECEPDCASATAKQCVQDCPAACLETDYAPEFCGKSCQNCLPYLRCVTRHSHNMTVAGKQDYHCDDDGFDKSEQWKDWKKCYSDGHPKRTHWNRHNTENYCTCNTDLKTAATAHNCCDAKWGKTLCDDQCETAKTTIACDSAEAKSCAEDCLTTCAALHTENMVPECRSKCMTEGGKCAKYSVCKPVGTFEFDYVCDDGKPPMKNGCCSAGGNRVTCPTLCDSGTPHYPIHSTAGYIWQHDLECQCLGCPSSTKAADDKWKKAMTEELWQNGVNTLAAISKEVGILGANRKMQELMAEQNKEILAVHEAFGNGQLQDMEFKRKVEAIVTKYRALIVAEAKLFKANGETETPALPEPIVTYSGSLTVKVAASESIVTTAVKKTVALEFKVPESDVTVVATESRRLDGVRAPPRQLAGNWAVTFTLVVAESRSAAVQSRATTLSTADLTNQMKSQLKLAGASASATSAMTVDSFSTAKAGSDTPKLETMPNAAPAQSSDNGRGLTGMVLGLIVACVSLLVVGGAILGYYFAKVSSRSSQARNVNTGAGPTPIEGDSNVVMGRPVEAGSGEAAAAAAAAAAAGAPVHTGGKEGQETGGKEGQEDGNPDNKV